MDSAAPVRSKAQEVPSLLQAVWDHGKRQGVRPEDAVRDPTVLWAAYESLAGPKQDKDQSRHRIARNHHVIVATADPSGPVSDVTNLATRRVKNARSPPRTSDAMPLPVFSRTTPPMHQCPPPAPLRIAVKTWRADDGPYKRTMGLHSNSGEHAHVVVSQRSATAAQAAAQLQHGTHHETHGVAAGAAVGSSAPSFATKVVPHFELAAEPMLFWGSSSAGFRPGEFGGHGAGTSARTHSRGHSYGSDESSNLHERNGGHRPDHDPDVDRRREGRRAGPGAASHSNPPPPPPLPSRSAQDRGGHAYRHRKRRDFEERTSDGNGAERVRRDQQRRRPIGGEPSDSIGDIVALYKHRLKSKGPTYYQPRVRTTTPTRRTTVNANTTTAAAVQPSAPAETARKTAPQREPVNANGATAVDHKRLPLLRQSNRHRSSSAPTKTAATMARAASTSAPVVAPQPAPLPLAPPEAVPAALPEAEAAALDMSCLFEWPVLPPPPPALSRSSSAAFRRQSSTASADTTRPSSGEYSNSPTHGGGGGNTGAAAAAAAELRARSSSSSSTGERGADINVSRRKPAKDPSAKKLHTTCRRPPWSIRGPGHDDATTRKGRSSRSMPQSIVATASGRGRAEAREKTSRAALVASRRRAASGDGGKRRAAAAASPASLSGHNCPRRHFSAEPHPRQPPNQRASALPEVPYCTAGSGNSTMDKDDAGGEQDPSEHAVAVENPSLSAEVSDAGAVVIDTCERWAQGYEALFHDGCRRKNTGAYGRSVSGRVRWVAAPVLAPESRAAVESTPCAPDRGGGEVANAPPPHAAAVLRAAVSALQEEGDEPTRTGGQGGGDIGNGSESGKRTRKRRARQKLKALLYPMESELGTASSMSLSFPQAQREARLAELRRLAVLGFPNDSDEGSEHESEVGTGIIDTCATVDGQGVQGANGIVHGKSLGSNGRTSCSLRGLAWKVLLDVAFVVAALYGDLVRNAAAEAASTTGDNSTGSNAKGAATKDLNSRGSRANGDSNDRKCEDGEDGDEAMAAIVEGMLENAPRELLESSRSSREGVEIKDGARLLMPVESAASSMAAILVSRHAQGRDREQEGRDGGNNNKKKHDLVNIVGDARRTFVGEPVFWQLFGGGTGGHDLNRSRQPHSSDTSTSISRGIAHDGDSSGQSGNGRALNGGRVCTSQNNGAVGAAVGAPTPWPLVRVLAAMNAFATLQPQQEIIPPPQPPHYAPSDSSPQPSPAPDSSAPSPPPAVPGYMPGLNALGGLLLVAMPECDAFFALHRLLANQMPAYYATQGPGAPAGGGLGAATTTAPTATPAHARASFASSTGIPPSSPPSSDPLGRSTSLAGAHRGCALVDACLAVLDPPLHAHLNAAASSPISAGSSNKSSKNNVSSTRVSSSNAGGASGGGGGGAYALPLLLSLFGAARPLQQVLLLWDALLALGPAFCVPLVVAQVLLLRADLLASSSPLALLAPRALPPLNAAALVRGALTAARLLPATMLAQICLHTTYVASSSSSSKEGSNIVAKPSGDAPNNALTDNFAALAEAAVELAQAAGALVVSETPLAEAAWNEKDARDVATITRGAAAAATPVGTNLNEGAVPTDKSTSSNSSLSAAFEWDDATSTLFPPQTFTLAPPLTLLCVSEDSTSSGRLPQPSTSSASPPLSLAVSSEFASVRSAAPDLSAHLRPLPLSIDDAQAPSSRRSLQQQQQLQVQHGNKAMQPGQQQQQQRVRVVRRRRLGVRAGDEDEASSLECTAAAVAGVEEEGDDESFEEVESGREIDLEATCVLVDGSNRSSSSDGWLLASDDSDGDDSSMNSMGPTPMARHSGHGNGSFVHNNNRSSSEIYSPSWPDVPLDVSSRAAPTAAPTTAAADMAVEAAAATTAEEAIDHDVWSTSSSLAASPRASPAPQPWPLPTAITGHEQEEEEVPAPRASPAFESEVRTGIDHGHSSAIRYDKGTSPPSRFRTIPSHGLPSASAAVVRDSLDSTAGVRSSQSSSEPFGALGSRPSSTIQHLERSHSRQSTTSSPSPACALPMPQPPPRRPSPSPIVALLSPPAISPSVADGRNRHSKDVLSAERSSLHHPKHGHSGSGAARPNGGNGNTSTACNGSSSTRRRSSGAASASDGLETSDAHVECDRERKM